MSQEGPRPIGGLPSGKYQGIPRTFLRILNTYAYISKVITIIYKFRHLCNKKFRTIAQNVWILYLYADIVCKQVTCGFPGAFRCVYGHQKKLLRTRTLLKKWQCAILVSSFIVRCTRTAVSFYASLSRKTEKMVAELTDHAAANVDARYKWKLNVLKSCPFPD